MHECAWKLDNKILMSEKNTTKFIKEIWNHKNTKDNKFKDININSDKKKRYKYKSFSDTVWNIKVKI